MNTVTPAGVTRKMLLQNRTCSIMQMDPAVRKSIMITIIPAAAVMTINMIINTNISTIINIIITTMIIPAAAVTIMTVMSQPVVFPVVLPWAMVTDIPVQWDGHLLPLSAVF